MKRDTAAGDKLTCQTGLTNCYGTCTNLQADYYNCGKCGAKCKAGQICATGIVAVVAHTAITGDTAIHLVVNQRPQILVNVGIFAPLVAAIAAYICVFIIARTHDPLGPVRFLLP